MIKELTNNYKPQSLDTMTGWVLKVRQNEQGLTDLKKASLNLTISLADGYDIIC